MESGLERGRARAMTGLVFVSVAMCLLGALAIWVNRGNTGVALVRLALVLLAAPMVYSGRRWAQWVLAFSALGGAVAGVVGILHSGRNVAGLVALVPMAGLCAAGLWLALGDAASRAFLSARRARIRASTPQVR